MGDIYPIATAELSITSDNVTFKMKAPFLDVPVVEVHEVLKHLRDQEFYFVLQPLVDLNDSPDGRIKRYEALMRSGDSIDTFSEEFKLKLDGDQEQVNEATQISFECLTDAFHKVDRDVVIHMNIAPQQITRKLPSLVKTWRYNNPNFADRVVFELTEGAPSQTSDRKNQIADRVFWLMSELSMCKFAVDDIPNGCAADILKKVLILRNLVAVKTANGDFLHKINRDNHIIEMMKQHPNIMLVVERVSDITAMRTIRRRLKKFLLPRGRVMYQGTVATHIIGVNFPFIA